MNAANWLQVSDREWHAGQYVIRKSLPWNRYDLIRETYIGRKLERRALGTFGRLDEAQEHAKKLSPFILHENTTNSPEFQRAWETPESRW